MASSPVYKPLDSTRESEEFEEENVFVAFLREPSRRRSQFLCWGLGLLCLALLSFNVFLLVRPIYGSKVHDGEVPLSKYAGLPKDVELPFVSDESEWLLNDDLWNTELMIGVPGMVAVSKDWAEGLGLPSSVSWPWDHSKGIYFMNAFHTLHCVAMLRTFVRQSMNGEPSSAPLMHLLHCADNIRDEVMCQGDDTLRYFGRLHDQAHEEKPHAGVGQKRQCRDFNKILEWVNDNSACYKPVNFSDPDYPILERYKYCPDGSTPWET